MNGQMKASISAVAAAVMLGACASKGAAGPAAGAAEADAQDRTSAEVQRLVDNVSNERICKRQAVTGSRIDSMVCLSRAEMEEQRENADRVMRDMRQSAAMGRQQVPDRPQVPTTPRNSP